MQISLRLYLNGVLLVSIETIKPFFVICIIFHYVLLDILYLTDTAKLPFILGWSSTYVCHLIFFTLLFFSFLSYKHLHCQTNVYQFQCSLHTCEIDYLIMGLCVHGRALICKYVVVFCFFVCLFFCHLFISLTIYDGTEGCVAGLVDWMTSWSFTNP